MKLRILTILCCVLLPAASTLGQSTPEKTPDLSTELRNAFNEVNGWVMKSAETVPADKYNYRPHGNKETFKISPGQNLSHQKTPET